MEVEYLESVRLIVAASDGVEDDSELWLSISPNLSLVLQAVSAMSSDSEAWSFTGGQVL